MYEWRNEMTYGPCVLDLQINDENHEGPLGKKGPVAGMAGMEGAPDLLDSFSLSAYVVRTAEKFCHRTDSH